MAIKLYFFNPYPGVGGADVTIDRFANSVDLKKFEVIYISLKKKKKFNKNIKFITIKSNSTFSSFFKIKKLLQKSKNEQQVFFSMQYYTNIWSVVFLHKIKKLKIFLYEINHPNEFNYANGLFDWTKKLVIKFLVKTVYQKADLIAANCYELSKDLSDFINKKVVTIFNPCFFKIIKKKQIKDGFVKILNVARFELQKDHMTLLKSIAYSPLKNKIKLTLVGYGSRLNQISQFIKNNKINAKIYTSTVKLEKFYTSNDLFILSSVYEGLPTVMIEAASHCLPIISSNFKSGSKEILNNGKNGYIFKIGDYKSLSNLINKFYHSNSIFLKKELRCRKVLSKFSYKKNVQLFNKSLNSLVD